MSEDLHTVDPDVVLEDVNAGDGNSDASVAVDEPFLKANDRTVYKTREDAIKGINEAGTRIGSLSKWEREAKAYGIDDPGRLKEFFEDYLKLKESSVKKPEPVKADDSKLTPEQRQAKEWLKKEAAELGYLPKEEAEARFKELMDTVAALKTGATQSEEQRFKNQEAEARSNLGSWLKEAKIEDDPTGTKTRIVGTIVKDWINGDDELIARWRQGGVEARNLVREGFDLALKSIGWSPAAATVGSSNYATDKARSVAANKKLPAPGTAANKGDGKGQPGRKVDPWAKMHEAAVKEFDSVINSRK